jgi:serine protease Do
MDLTQPLARRYGILAQSGFLVAEVVPDSPAHAAGMRVGDVVAGAGGHAVAHTKDLLLALSQVQPGESIELDVNRMGSQARLQVWPEEAPMAQRYEGR